MARVLVPRVFGGVRQHGSGSLGKGTGWLIAPDLLITNHHVVEARDPRWHEPPAEEPDFRAQAEAAVAWFDYFEEGGPHVECPLADLVHSLLVLFARVVRLVNVIEFEWPRPMDLDNG